MAFSDPQRGTLMKIHYDVMQEITYLSDYFQFGLEEFWMGDEYFTNRMMTRNGRRFGDCDEFAIEYMKRAMREGFHARLIFCLTEDYGGHLITEVVPVDHSAALYLDNRRLSPVGLRGISSYIFISASPWNPRPGDRRAWRNITGIQQ